jgi:hypothetical protein
MELSICRFTCNVSKLKEYKSQVGYRAYARGIRSVHWSGDRRAMKGPVNLGRVNLASNTLLH